PMSWRTLSVVLMVVCAWQAWRGCHRAPARVADTPAECTRETARNAIGTASRDERDERDEPTAAPPAAQPAASGVPGLSLGGFKVPAWATWLAPQPGENLLDYRDRIVPIAQAAIAPQRERIARSRDDLIKRIGLDTQQRAQLDAAAQNAATAIQDKVMGALM